jgi:hypothetical protein
MEIEEGCGPLYIRIWITPRPASFPSIAASSFESFCYHSDLWIFSRNGCSKWRSGLRALREIFAVLRPRVLDESAAIGARLDRIEQKVDQILAELRR